MGGGWRGATNASKAIMDKQSDKERERNQLSWHVDHIPRERG